MPLQDDRALLHDVIAVGQLQGELEILLHQQHRHAGPRCLSVCQHVADQRDDRRLNALGRLVEDQQLGSGDQGAGDGELLLLAAAEHAALAVEHALRASGK